MTVERSVNDLILVDDALNESMLNPRIQESEVKENVNDQTSKTEEVIAEDNPEVALEENKKGNVQQDDTEITIEAKSRNTDKDNYETVELKDDTKQDVDVRRSQRERKQRFNIHPDEMGDCDDENDEDYK